MAEGEEVEVAEEDVGVGAELEVDGDVKLVKKSLHYCIASHLFGSSSKNLYIYFCIVSYHNIVR